MDLSITKIKPNLEEKFKEKASNLMLNYGLKTLKNCYHFAEIEFYLFQKDIHPDSSTHCCERQKTIHNWYLNRYKNCDMIKTGNRKGIDITSVDPERNIYGGILIRAIQNQNIESDYVYGPSKVVDRILEDSNCTFKDIEVSSVFENRYLKIVSTKHLDQRVLPCPRYNLGKNTPIEFRELGYRFITYPEKQHNGKETEIFKYLSDRCNKSDLLKPG